MLSTDNLTQLQASGRFAPQQLTKAAEVANRRREKLWMRGADLLFGLIALLWGKINILVLNSAGKYVSPTDPSVAGNSDAKLDAIIGGIEASQTSQLLREFFRPMIVSLAALLHEWTSIDETLMHLTPIPALPGAPAVTGGGGAAPASYVVGTPVALPAGSQPIAMPGTTFKHGDGSLVTTHPVAAARAPNGAQYVQFSDGKNSYWVPITPG